MTKTRPGLANNALADLTYRNMELVGAPTYAEEAKEFGREIQRTLGLEPMAEPFPEAFEELISPQEYEAATRKLLPEWQKNFTSDDYTDYTWHAPTVRLFTGRPVLRTPHPGYEYPAWAYNAMGGRPEIVDPGMFLAGKTIAGTMLDLLTAAVNWQSQGRVQGAHRRRGRRRAMGRAAPAARLPAADRPALAGIHHDRARRGMVDSHAGPGRQRAHRLSSAASASPLKVVLQRQSRCILSLQAKNLCAQ